MTYDVVTWQEGKIWSSHAPSVSGVYGLGSTSERAERDLVKGLRELSSYLATVGEKLPRPRIVTLGQVKI
jgi:hypothetical protein